MQTMLRQLPLDDQIGSGFSMVVISGPRIGNTILGTELVVKYFR